MVTRRDSDPAIDLTTRLAGGIDGRYSAVSGSCVSRNGPCYCTAVVAKRVTTLHIDQTRTQSSSLRGRTRSTRFCYISVTMEKSRAAGASTERRRLGVCILTSYYHMYVRENPRGTQPVGR